MGCPIDCIADNSHADWEGLCDHLRDFHGKISLNLVLLLLLVSFVNFASAGSELMYISIIKNIRSSLTNIHGFQLLELLPYFIKITFFICTIRMNLLLLK